MDTKKLLPRFIISILLVGCLLAQAIPGKAAPAAAINLACGCSFGYSAQQVLPEQWIDVTTTGIPLALTGDDGVVSQPIGFSFPFFENTYTSAYVSTNGFISFNVLNGNAYSNNYQVPAEFLPNNIIAGFWDDLTVGVPYNSGAVYYKLSGDVGDRIAIFEWAGVTRLNGGANLLTFEIVLSEHGDITFNYNSLDLNADLTKATVGIEDADGVDGCLLLYNDMGLGSSQSYRLARPSNGYRVKAKPLYQGQFLVNGTIDLPVTVVNTGTSADSFHFQSVVLDGASDWQIQMLGPNKAALANTPSIASKGTYQSYIRVNAVKTAPLGSYVKGRLTILSNGNPAKTFTISFDAAIPAPFAEFYVDSSAGYVRYILPHLQQTIPVFPSFTGSSLAITRFGDFNYALSWEYIQKGAQYYENIQKAVARPTSGLTAPITNLADNTNQSTLDANPVTAVAPDGTIGLVFVRSIQNADRELKTNIYFARLDANGSLISPVTKLTNNTTYTYELLFNAPVIAATTNNQFVIAYEAMTLVGSNFAKNIDLAVLDTDGQVLSQPHSITDSEGDGLEEYYTPAVTQMLDGNVFLAFLSLQSGTQLGQIMYTTVQAANGTIDTATPLSDAYGEGTRADTLDDGTILLAWVNDGSLSAGFTLFPQGVLANVLTASTLQSANGWRIGNISLTKEINGNGVITWQDEWGYFLFYALVAPDGDVLTPPMAYQRGSNASNPNIISSSTGKSVAPLSYFWPIYLPVTRK